MAAKLVFPRCEVSGSSARISVVEEYSAKAAACSALRRWYVSSASSGAMRGNSTGAMKADGRRSELAKSTAVKLSLEGTNNPCPPSGEGPEAIRTEFWPTAIPARQSQKNRKLRKLRFINRFINDELESTLIPDALS